MSPSRSPSQVPRADASRRRSRSPQSPRRNDKRSYKDSRDRSPRRDRSRDRYSHRQSPRRDRSGHHYERPRSPRGDRYERPDRNQDRGGLRESEAAYLEREERERKTRLEREPERKPKVPKGFKFKETRRDEAKDEPKCLQRGYRDRSPKRDYRDAPKGNSVEDKFGASAKFGAAAASRIAASSSVNVDDESGPSRGDTSKPPTRAPPAPSVGPSDNEPMIVVYVNDRLGTKAKIPCLASDPIRLFKAQVAARIGRQPHEILLKRQGERPFKDQLTLEDYGVGNGVQLDLEIDTGD